MVPVKSFIPVMERKSFVPTPSYGTDPSSKSDLSSRSDFPKTLKRISIVKPIAVRPSCPRIQRTVDNGIDSLRYALSLSKAETPDLHELVIQNGVKGAWLLVCELCFNIAAGYEGFAKDEAKAAALAQKIANNTEGGPMYFGRAMHLYLQPEISESDQDYHPIAELFKEAAHRGVALAYTMLGVIELDDQKACKFFASAVQKGEVHAHVGLGCKVLQGKGEEAQKNLKIYGEEIGKLINDQRAFELFSEAKRKGNACAINNLGCMIAEDKGLAAQENLRKHGESTGHRMNIQRAIELFMLARKKGSPLASNHLEQLQAD